MILITIPGIQISIMKNMEETTMYFSFEVLAKLIFILFALWFLVSAINAYMGNEDPDESKKQQRD